MSKAILTLSDLKKVFDDEDLSCALCSIKIKVGDDIIISIRHDGCPQREPIEYERRVTSSK